MTDDEIRALLPWYINNTLSKEVTEAVEALLARSQVAQEELKVLKSIADQVTSERQVEASELGWRRLQRDIRAEQLASESSGSPEPQLGWWKKGMSVAAALVIALQVGILAQSPSDETSTRLLGESLPGLEQPHWLIQVEFQAEANWQSISDVINEMDGRVVDGPSSIGLVRIAVFKSGSQFETKEALLSWLRQQSVVVHVAIDGER